MVTTPKEQTRGGSEPASAPAAAARSDARTDADTSDQVDTRASAIPGAGLSAALEALTRTPPFPLRGRVHGALGLGLRATLPGARLGERCRVFHVDGGEAGARDPNGAPAADDQPASAGPTGAGPKSAGPSGASLEAEVVGFDHDDVMLMPLGSTRGIGPGALVARCEGALSVTCGMNLLGRILDGLGQPIDGGPPLTGQSFQVHRASPSPLARPPIDQRLSLGVRVLDALVTVGEGQRLGLFAGSGVGKTTLLGQMARQAEVDVVVFGLVGERGRELRELLEDVLDDEGRRRSVVVCATSDAPPLVRLKSAHVATAIAEWFRAQGKRVLLLIDSLTRFARAGREVGLAAGEPPSRRGFPPSAFAALPGLLERAGRVTGEGSITGIYTVLVEGGDLEEPVSDEIRGLLDGHVVLSRTLAERGRFPPVDPISSLSRLATRITDASQQTMARELRAHLARYEEHRDIVLLGAYKAGSNPQLDETLRRIETIERFLRQSPEETSPVDETWRRLEDTLRA